MEVGLRHHVVQLECCGPVSVYVQVIFKMIMRIQGISNNKMMMIYMMMIIIIIGIN